MFPFFPLLFFYIFPRQGEAWIDQGGRADPASKAGQDELGQADGIDRVRSIGGGEVRGTVSSTSKGELKGEMKGKMRGEVR